MKDSALLHLSLPALLYRTAPGRMILSLLVQPKVSEAVGRFLSSGLSRGLVPYYIRKHGIDMSDIEIPEKGFPSFNAFFTRKRKRECCDLTWGHLISPCDGFLTCTRVRENTVFSIKNTEFSLEDLLKNPALAARFRNGTALIFRLTPADYHRYCYAASGKILYSRKIQGKLHCVRPIALRTLPVFVQNSREYQVIGTEKFGLMVQMEVGALLVGKIKNHRRSPGEDHVQGGGEKGYFEFGGSTIILLLEKDAIRFHEKLYERQNTDGEMPVRKGEFIACVQTEGHLNVAERMP